MMIKTFKIEPSFAGYFTREGVEFEIRITDEGDKLEIWELEYENNECIGFKDIVAEFNFEDVRGESEIRTCNVCKKRDEYENMIMDIREILECSEQTITEWENKNKNICLLDWFCDSCSTKVINEIEGQD